MTSQRDWLRPGLFPISRIAAVCVLNLLASSCRTLPSDTELDERFRSHKTEFLYLMQMFQHDEWLISVKVGYAVVSTDQSGSPTGNAIRIRLATATDSDWATWETYGFSRKKYAGYVEFFKNLGLNGLGRDDGRIVAPVEPIDENQLGKGFIYSEGDLVSCSCDLDAYRLSKKELEERTVIYKWIAPHWYIFMTKG